MKRLMAVAAMAALAAGCAGNETKTAAAPAPAPAKPACEPAPKTLVKKDLKEGDGRTAVPLATAMVFYTGWVYDPCAPEHKGVQFDSNASKPVPFGLRIGAGRVIKGWDEGLPGMKEGGKRLLIIPADMAYGERAVGDKIPAHSTLVFEVTLAQLANIPGQPAPSFTAPPK
jgi:FKBP-type peptidyl-prolyl cis-trans isomerase FkpA